MQTLEEWLKSIEWLRAKQLTELFELYFHRDPFRPLVYNPRAFYSPADGIVVYCEQVKPGEQIIDIKGENYTLKELLRKDTEEECLVIGIFMTPFDVHINRMPTDGLITWRKEPVKTKNLSMVPVEIELFRKKIPPPEAFKYMVYNERVINRVYVPRLGIQYYVIQVADSEVNVIAHFVEQNSFVQQGERFSVVRFGSQVDLVIPLKNLKPKIEAKLHHHVEAGKDAIASF